MSKIAKRLNNLPKKPATATAEAPSHSTGPRTPEGKAISSQNAVKHGLTSSQVHIPEGRQAEFKQLQNELTEQLNPNGALEHTIFARLVRASWNLRRVDEIEDGILMDFDPADETQGKQLDRMTRYRTANERSFYRALKELKALQTNRVLRECVDDQLDEDTPQLLDIKDFAKRTTIELGARRPKETIVAISQELGLIGANTKVMNHAGFNV